MIAVIIAVILLICIWVLAVQDMLSHWMDDSNFEEEQEQEHDDSGYDWRDNIKGYRKDEEDNKKIGQD
jgi:type VI protein secretion system component VasK